MSDNRDIGYCVFGFGFGIWSFFWGFNRLRRKRLIENIPTSTVRGLAMGLVELVGKAKRKNILKGPLSNIDCVLYRYSIERYEQRGKSSQWVTIAQGNSFQCLFYIDDGTGKILVSPEGAELVLTVDYKFQTGLGKVLPEHLVTFMNEHNLKYRGLFGNRQLRFQEWHILPEQTVYVLGVARKDENVLKKNNEILIKRLEELKLDPQKMSALDTDKDGIVSPEEWDSAVRQLERELLENELTSGQPDEHADVVVGKGEEEKVFIISDQSQKEITHNFFWQAILGVWGGAALTLAMLAYLLLRFNIF